MSSSPKITGFRFNSAGIEPQQAFEALPNGWYPMSITDGEMSPNDNGAGQRMSLEWTVLDGPFKNRKFFDGFNVQHSNQQTQEIAQKQLAAICHAIQVFAFEDIQALFNKPHDVKVDQQPGRWVGPDGKELKPQPVTPAGAPAGSKFYDAQNRFRGAEPLGKKTTGGAGSPAGAVPAGAPVPAWAAKPASAPAPAAGVAPTTPPWGAAAPAAPAAKPAAPAAPAKPAAPPAPKPVAPPKAAARKFFVFIDGTNMPLKSEAEVFAMLQSGMPPETQMSLAGADDGFVDANGWKPAGELLQAAAPAPVPTATTSAGAPVAPPWARG